MSMAKCTNIITADADYIVEKMGDALAPLANSTMLVTGSSGFLCSYYLDMVAAFNRRHPNRPCRVIAIDNDLIGHSERVRHLADDPNFLFVEHDISKPYEPLWPVHWLIHGGGIASPTYYRRFPLETIDVNVDGLRQMLRLARQPETRSMLYLSTSEVYGDPDPAWVPTPETYRGNVSCTGPRACYDESKRLGETLCVTYHQLYATPVKIIRPFNVYGPGISLDDHRVIPDFVAAALQKQPITLLSDGRATRSFCYVRDFIMGSLWVMLRGRDGEPYNVGNDEEVSILDVARLAAALRSPPLAVTHATSEDAHYLTDNPQRRCPDLAKLLALAPAWHPEIRVREGLARMFSSYAG
ncbi:NAD-dependent epimerase/dehydratase family protein [Candidatus Accumulibacter vicinus]|uniref:dTDP-4-dehydro-6-deoxyglucose reductase n=1 Tax=Candidatus Accumulibacter vicinus TaxID=2954382 RepID=A0A084XZ68_9PROT|nr:NAD-dependent epimerase/dehydratase family protein [Candidatus Accumulibacter vicinus]KFB67762.1 MAG: dTDP-4-dehydro-6-deoxyglucose reductase [Candidatus Accumulibacter vicinus]